MTGVLKERAKIPSRDGTKKMGNLCQGKQVKGAQHRWHAHLSSIPPAGSFNQATLLSRIISLSPKRLLVLQVIEHALKVALIRVVIFPTREVLDMTQKAHLRSPSALGLRHRIIQTDRESACIFADCPCSRLFLLFTSCSSLFTLLLLIPIGRVYIVIGFEVASTRPFL